MNAASGMLLTPVRGAPEMEIGTDAPGSPRTEFPNHRVSVLVANIERNLHALADTIASAGPRLAERSTREDLLRIRIAIARVQATMDTHHPAPLPPPAWPPVIVGRLEDALDATHSHAVPNPTEDLS